MARGACKQHRRNGNRPARWLSVAALCAVAACTVPGGRSDREVNVYDLARAVGSQRISEGRLPGGFVHAPPSTGNAPVRLNPEATTVAARLLKQFDASASELAAALGAAEARLAFGEVDAAIDLLDRYPSERLGAPMLTVVAVAYRERARRHDNAEAAARAADAAERAVRLDPNPIESWFNRAAALERLGFVAEAVRAWQDYLQRETDRGWRTEATARLAVLRTPDDGWNAFKRSILAGSTVSDSDVRQAVRDHADRCRQLAEDDLLRRWADAILSGDRQAGLVSLRSAARIAIALTDIRGDRTLHDFVRRVQAGSTRQAARGVLAGIRARAAIDRGEVEKAVDDLKVARESLGARPTDAELVDLYTVLVDYYRARYDRAIPGLRRLAKDAAARHHLYVLARSQFVLAAIAVRQARFTDAEDLYRGTADLFERCGETGYLASLHGIVSNRHWQQGDPAGAWQEYRRALVLTSAVAEPMYLYSILRKGQSAAVDGRLPGLAVHFTSALVETAEAWNNPVVLVATLAEQGRQLALAGDRDGAQNTIARARTALDRITDGGIRAVSSADVARAEGDVLAPTRPCEAVSLYTSAVETLTLIGPNRLPTAFLARGKANRACGRISDAETDFRAGIRLFESQRVEQRDEQLRVSLFDQVWDLYGELVRLLAFDRGRSDDALLVAEQSRARALRETLGPTDVRPVVAMSDLQAGLPQGLVALSYVTLSDRVLVWAVTRSSVTFRSVDARQADVARLVAEWQRAVLNESDDHGLGRRLFDLLVRPLENALPKNGTAVVIADGPLHGVPFAGLWDGQAYLVERCAFWSAPSVGLLSWAASRLNDSRNAGVGVLAVGDPSHSLARFGRLPRLADAAREASDVARLYPRPVTLIAGQAVKGRILDEIGRAAVVHVAAHAVANPIAPNESYIITAATPTGDDVITPVDVARLRRMAARLIVLSACQTAAGRIARGEGVMSLSRAFMAVGIPIVVANLWDASDRGSYEFFVGLHRELTAGRMASEALRSVQLRFLHGADLEQRRPRAWAGVVGAGATGAVMREFIQS